MAAGGFALDDVVIAVMIEMAALAECGQVEKGIVGFVLVDVGDGEDNDGSGDGVRLAVDGGAPFAAAAGAIAADEAGAQAPVMAICGVVNGHW